MDCKWVKKQLKPKEKLQEVRRTSAQEKITRMLCGWLKSFAFCTSCFKSDKEKNYSVLQCNLMSFMERCSVTVLKQTQVTTGDCTCHQDSNINLSRKKKSGGIAWVVIEKWCNQEHVNVKEHWHEPLALKMLVEGIGHCCCVKPGWINTLFWFIHQQRSSKWLAVDD